MQTIESNGKARSTVRAACVGLKVGIIASTVLGVLESLAIVCLTAKHFEGGWRPTDLILAGMGKTVLTHAFIWCPVLAIAGASRARWAAPAGGLVPFLVALFVLLAGTTVVGLSLSLVLHAQTLTVVAACIGVVAASALVYVFVRWLIRRLKETRSARILNILATMSVVVVAGLTVAFARSPFWNAANYRAASHTVPASEQNRPNVLWIVLDTVRADRLGCYGYDQPTTPFIDRFAENAIVFERAVANGIWTVPSHAAMFTGKPTRAHGMDYFHLQLDDGFDTVAQRLSDAGYATASFSNNAWISRATQLARGFDTCRATRYLTRLGRSSIDHLLERIGWSSAMTWFDHDHGAAVTSHVVAQWLDEQAGSDAPLFVFVNLMEAHLPYRVPRAYRRMMMSESQVDRSYQLRWRAYGNLAPTMCFRFNMEDPAFLPLTDRDILRKQYDACVRYLDDRVEELVAMFADRGMLENTLVVIASDHGEYLDTHELWEHRYLTYDDVSRVALIVRQPGKQEQRRVTSPVQLSDLYATVLATTLGEKPAVGPYESRDLLAIAAGEGRPRTAFVEYNGPIPVSFRPDPATARHDTHRDQPQRAAHDGRYKLLVSTDGTRELYDVLADPGETRNLIETHADEADRLSAELTNWENTVPEYVSTSGETLTMDPDLKRTLQNLGYVGDDRGDMSDDDGNDGEQEP